MAPVDEGQIITLSCEGATCKIAVHGAHVLSWKSASGRELLYMSELATFAEGKTALRGGIPICWPAFAGKNPKIGKHGFVRTATDWEVVPVAGGKTEADKDASLAQLKYTTTFNRCFVNGTDKTDVTAENKVTLLITFLLTKNTLGLHLAVENAAPEPLPFSGCLHTYFAKDEAKTDVEVSGFKCFKSTRELGKQWENEDDVVKVDGKQEVERMFFVPKAEKDVADMQDSAAALDPKSLLEDKTTIQTHANPCVMRFEPFSTPEVLTLYTSKSIPDSVVWNIGSSAPDKIPKDMAEKDELRYLCVEPGLVEQDAVVPAQGSWTGWHVMELSE
ncbi:unnamed protein product [Amoebophrya sp. A120]|nr:unnamed protein product [Amoebophrya sp. A120]|eukprot:GSA120T00006569001.1